MKKRPLGKTGIDVSEISFGAVEIGLPYGIGVTSQNDMLSDNDAIDLLNTAVDKGINTFDTARSYGRSEELIGRAFKDRRDDVVICTKCAHLRDEQGQLLPPGILTQKMNESLEQSLSVLQMDAVDVYMSHSGQLEIINNRQIVDTFSEFKHKGLVRAIGVSTYTVEETTAAINSGNWDVIQIPLNLMDQRHGAIIPLARQKGVGLLVRSVLFKGILTDRGQNLHPELKSVQDHRQNYENLLDENAPTLSTLATKFVLSFEGVSSALLGIDRIDYLNQALGVADGKYLSNNKIQQIKKLAYPDPDFLNLPLWDRKGWL